MVRSDERVFEVVGGVVGHPEALHDVPRALVANRGIRDDLVPSEELEPEVKGSGARLGGVTVAPGLPTESPADLDRRRERRSERRCRQTSETKESSVVASLHRPEPESVHFPVLENPGEEQVGRRAVEAPRHVPHDLGVAVDCRKWPTIRSTEPAQGHASGFEAWGRHAPIVPQCLVPARCTVGFVSLS